MANLKIQPQGRVVRRTKRAARSTARRVTALVISKLAVLQVSMPVRRPRPFLPQLRWRGMKIPLSISQVNCLQNVLDGIFLSVEEEISSFQCLDIRHGHMYLCLGHMYSMAFFCKSLLGAFSPRFLDTGSCLRRVQCINKMGTGWGRLGCILCQGTKNSSQIIA